MLWWFKAVAYTSRISELISQQQQPYQSVLRRCRHSSDAEAKAAWVKLSSEVCKSSPVIDGACHTRGEERRCAEWWRRAGDRTQRWPNANHYLISIDRFDDHSVRQGQSSWLVQPTCHVYLYLYFYHTRYVHTAVEPHLKLRHVPSCVVIETSTESRCIGIQR